MKIIEPSVEVLHITPRAARLVELAGRTCYKSEDGITPESSEAFIQKLLKTGHESVIEHAGMTVRFVCDRGVSIELVRHRLASYSQESTRYCNYAKDKFGGGLTLIRPCFLDISSVEFLTWRRAMQEAENTYLAMLKMGLSPQEARTVLPSSLKTEVVMTANMREWRHVIRLRCSRAAHPQIRQVMLMLHEKALEESESRPFFAGLFEEGVVTE